MFLWFPNIHHSQLHSNYQPSAVEIPQAVICVLIGGRVCYVAGFAIHLYDCSSCSLDIHQCLICIIQSTQQTTLVTGNFLISLTHL